MIADARSLIVDERSSILIAARRASRRRLQITSLIGPHDRYAIANRKGESICLADQFLRFFIMFERPLADRANQDIK